MQEQVEKLCLEIVQFVQENGLKTTGIPANVNRENEINDEFMKKIDKLAELMKSPCYEIVPDENYNRDFIMFGHEIVGKENLYYFFKENKFETRVLKG